MLQVRVESHLRPSVQQGCHWADFNEIEASSTAFCKHPHTEQLQHHRQTDWRCLHLRRSFLLRSKRQRIWLFNARFTFYEGLCFLRQESDHTRICEVVYFVSNFLFSFRFYPTLFCLRSALWLPWRHSKPEANYSSPAAASLLCLEHPLRPVAPLCCFSLRFLYGVCKWRSITCGCRLPAPSLESSDSLNS